MAKNEEYKGSIDLISGLRPKNGANFPLMEASDILTGDNDKRLDADLANIFAQLLTMATKEYVQSKLAELVASSPEALDTLNELAAALGNDPNFATTVLNKLTDKVDKVSGKGLSTHDLTDALLEKLNVAVKQKAEFEKEGNVITVSSGNEVKDSGVSISSFLKPDFVWYANKDAVARVSNPFVKIGGIADFKQPNNMFSVVAAASVLDTVIVADLKATTVDASVAAGNYSKFHNGDLLMYAGKSMGQEVWRWIPQAEAKEDRDGLESAWDKQQVNKVQTIERDLSTLKSSVANLPQEVTFHTEAALLNWISIYGIHYCVAQAGNGANPLGDEHGLEYLVYVGRDYDGKDFTGKRFQLAIHLSTGRRFIRVGDVNSGASFGSYSWSELGSGLATGIEDVSDSVIFVTENGQVIACDENTREIVATVNGGSFDILIPEKVSPNNAWINWSVLINLTGVESVGTIDVGFGPYEMFAQDAPWDNFEAGKTYLLVKERNYHSPAGYTRYEVDNVTKLANGSVAEDKLSEVVLDRMTEVIECKASHVNTGPHAYSFSGKYREVRFVNERYGGTSYCFPDTAPERSGTEHYKAYHVEIFQEYEQSEECSAFLSAFDCRPAGHYDVDIVYDFVNSKWRVASYEIKPYAEDSVQ